MKILKQSVILAVLAVLTGSVVLLASPDIKLRLLEGVREGTQAGPTAVTSSFGKLDMMGTLPPDYSLDLEIAKIKKIFNMKEVRLITEANLRWPPQGDKIFHIIQFEDREFLVLVTPQGDGAASKFRVEVFEQKDNGTSQTDLLDAKFQLPANETVYLGYEDTKSNAYFLYLTWPTEVVVSGVEGGVTGGVEGGVVGGVTGGVEGAVRAVGDVEPPKLIKLVEPVYPEIARQAKVEGVVICEATTDVRGHVIDVRILRSIPLLDQAAVDALRQWVYEPKMIDGKPQGITFTTTIAFRLKDIGVSKKETAQIGSVDVTYGPSGKPVTPGVEGGMVGGVKGGVQGGITGPEDITPPKLVFMVEPSYPEIARLARVQGIVVVEAMVDETGKVQEVKVIDSIPLLDQPAVEAVKRWVFSPMLVKGKPRGIIFRVNVGFRLKDPADLAKNVTVSVGVTDEEFAKGAVKVVGEIKPPKLIKAIDPVYPFEAKQARMEGVVILAVRTSVEGRVKAARILRSIPKLDQAALDAIRQWEYEPLIINGKPVEAVFTVTVRFEMKKTG